MTTRTAPDGFEDTASIQQAPAGTVADLKMENGRVYRAALQERGLITAWWVLRGNRKAPIGLYEPIGWRKIEGVQATPHTPPTW